MDSLEKQFSFDPSFLKNLKFINEVKIFNEIQNSKKIIIFDLRSKEEFTSHYLELSLNIAYNEHNPEFFENICKGNLDLKFSNVCEEISKRLKTYKRYFIAILMSEKKIKKAKVQKLDFSDLEANDKEKIIKSLLFYRSLVSNGVRELGIFCYGMEKIVQHYNFLLNYKDKEPQIKDIATFPTDFIHHRLFVGNQRDAYSEEVINLLGITHVVNVTRHVSNKFEEKGIKYLNIDIEDTPEYKISKYFQIAFHFIDEALSLNNDFFQPLDGNSCCFNSENDVIPEDWEICLTSSKDLLAKDKIIQDVCKSLFYPKECTGRVLVHCSLGASRSTTIAIMYIMKKFKLCFEDAFSLMCLHREKCAPIDSFVEELKQFEMNDFEFNKDSIN